VMNDPPFKSRLICVAVDECHLITKWGNSFRPECEGGYYEWPRKTIETIEE
jgi:hypothetical protein